MNGEKAMNPDPDAASSPSPDRTDQALMDAYHATRSQDALAEIIARHGKFVYAACLGVLNDHHAAEDAAQTTFMVFCQKAAGLKSAGSLRAWLFEAARLTALVARRRRAVRHKHEAGVAAFPRAPAEASAMDLEHLRSQLHEALGHLTPKLRKAVVLHHLAGLSVTGTSEELNSTISATSMRITRGLEQMRKFLAKRGVALSAAGVAGLIEQAQAVELPAGFAARTLAACTGQAAVSVSTAALVKGVHAALFWSKVKLAAVWMTAAAIVAGLVGGLMLAGNAAKPAAIAPAVPIPAVEPLRQALAPAPTEKADVCVYAATPGGVLAAVAAAREGHRVLVVEPSRWVGGMLGAGERTTMPYSRRQIVGGLARQTYGRTGLTPNSARACLAKLLAEHKIPVLYEHRVASVEKDGALIRRLRLEKAPPDRWGCPAAAAEPGPGIHVEAAVFIDAGYEGDVMARAGVSYAVGREPAAQYGESCAGFRGWNPVEPVDPFTVPGDPAGGLLPWIESDHGKRPGDAVEDSQACYFRLFLTTDPEARAPFTPPEDYDPMRFEFAGRYVDYLVQHDKDLDGIFPGYKNQNAYEFRRSSLITVAPPGLSRLYQDGDNAARARVWKTLIDYLRGLHHFMSTDPRVPAAWREEVAATGLDATHHPDTAGWPPQICSRVTRRMIGAVVLTQDDLAKQTAAENPIGLSRNFLDLYPGRLAAVKDPRTGQFGATTEKKIWGRPPGSVGSYLQIPYRAITPKAEECANLLVPVCLSASFIAASAVREEPTLMVLGESAGLAAAQAVEERTGVQGIDGSRLQDRLRKAGQILVPPPEPSK
jgi:RNA polymerase sigma factor (sigma-70 family)